MEEWVPLISYPGYSVSNHGRVRNDRTERLLKIGRLPTNNAIVGLYKNGEQVKRSVAKLVCETFVPTPRPNFTTPIHFDGDPFNCRVDNMDWRPRWFAQEHTHQFRIDLPEYPDPVREITTGEVFENCWKAVTSYGLLYIELVRCIRLKTYIFPTMQKYEWLT